jgi:hypothetical protein
MTKETGEPAFPVEAHPSAAAQRGMTLHDYFAGQAMAGLAANYSQIISPEFVESMSELAYDLADAMIKARKNVK